MLQHPGHPFMLANIDRMVVGKNAGLEIKTTSLLNKARFCDGEVPQQYVVQAMHYMAVTDAEEWYLYVLVLGKACHTFRIERNEAEIAALIEAERRFWEEHIQRQVPPDPDGSDSCNELIRTLFPKERGNSIMMPLFGEEEKIQRILSLEAQIRDMERESDALKQQIQLTIGEADGGRAQGYSVWWKSQERTSIDTKRLQKEMPDIYRQYSRTSNFRKFEIREE